LVSLAVICGVIPVAFLAMGIVRAYPFADDVQVPARFPDDWHTYKQLALSVIHDGLSMPALAASFGGIPHGFLYIYFLALVFTVAGVNATYVYIVQSFALGASISLMYLVVRDRVSEVGGVLFAATLTALMYLDVFRHLTFKLLSENLYFLLCPLLLLFLFRSVEGIASARRDGFIAGALLGSVVLTRPSFILSAAMLIAAAGMYAFVTGRSSWPPILLLLGTGLVMSLVAWRDYAATGRASIDIVADTSDWLRLWQLPPAAAATTLIKRALFVFGYTDVIKPEYRLRLQWMIVWLLWAIYPLVKLRRRESVELWEALLYLYAACYIGPVVLVAADITSYGGRMVAAILPVLLVAPFRLFFPIVKPEPCAASTAR
jgi:hypothetical protein